MRLLLASALAFVVSAPAAGQIAPLNEHGMTFGHVHLNVSDIELHKKFWAEQFGAEIIQKGPLTAAKFPGQLIIFTQRAPTGGSQGTVMDHFGFKVRDMSTALAKWRAAGYEVQSEFTGAEGFPNAYIMGPDSVRLELQEDKTLPVDVSGYHIHFFTPQYQELMAWYVEMFDVEPFQRGSIATTANAPGMNLSFGTARTETAATRGRSIDHIGFDFADLEAVVRQLEAKGVKLEGPIRELASVGLKIAFLTDPAGTYLELTQGLVDF